MESPIDSSVDPAYEFFDAPKGGSLQELNSENHDQWFDKLAQNNNQPTFEELQKEQIEEEVPVSSIKRKRSMEEESEKLEQVFQDYAASANEFLQQEEAEEQHREAEENNAYEENVHDDEVSDERPNSHYSSFKSRASNFNRTNGSFRVVQERPLKLTVPRSPNLLTATRARHHYEPSWGETTHRQEPRMRESYSQPLHLTVPRSPRLLTAERSVMKRKPELTTEEMQLLELQEENERLHKRRKVIENYMYKALVAAQHFPERSAKELTQPEEFHFHTEDRIRMKHNEEYEEEQPQRRPMRTNYNSLTVPEPFHFHSQDRILMKYGEEPQPSEYKTFSEQTMQFHMGARSPQNKRNQRPKRVHRPLQPTVPEEFHLSTAERAMMKPQEHILTTEERKILEAESIPKFKARPLNKKVFEFSAPAVERYEAPLTEPEPFRFATDDRLGPKEIISKRVVEPQSLRGTFNFSDTMSSTSRHYTGPTLPKSPNLHTKQRAYGKPSLQQLEEERRQKEMKEAHFRARPVPHVAPFRPKPVDLPLTEPEPFSLRTEVRGSELQNRLAEKLERERREEEQARLFKARPLPSFQPMVSHGHEEDDQMDHPYGTLTLPPSNLPLTEPEPFRLKTEERGHAASEQFKILIDEEVKREKQARQFKAKPFVQKPAFQPEKSTRPLTELTEIVLNSDRRAVKRQAWENERTQKEIAYLQAKQQLEEEQREREARELEHYRKTLVHHPVPLKKLKAFEPKPAEYSLTQPQSPMLKTKTRFAMRDL